MEESLRYLDSWVVYYFLCLIGSLPFFYIKIMFHLSLLCRTAESVLYKCIFYKTEKSCVNHVLLVNSALQICFGRLFCKIILFRNLHDATIFLT